MNSPLHLACYSGFFEIAKLLIESGANIELKNPLQETPLHKATLFNHFEVIKFLLARGVDVECCDKDNQTPLLMAVRKNYVETVKLLLEYSASIYAKDSNDKTCLSLAAQENSKEALEILCKLDIQNLLEEIDKYGMTPLHIAAKQGHENIVQTLLSLGACIDAKCHESLTPLHLAAKNGHLKIVQLLLSNVLNIVNDVDDSSNTPLHLAAMEGHVKVVEMLIEVGSAVHTRNANQMTPLDCASYRGWYQCAQCLLDADSIINPSDKVKLVKLLTDPYHYFHIHRVVELSAYIFSLVYATKFEPFHSEVNSFQCSYLQRQLGGAIVTLSWLGFVLLVRRFPKLGIYVVMFLHILKRFTKFFPIWFLFIVAFGLGLHLVMFIELSSFSTPARSFVMLLTAMWGEFDFDTIFNPDPPFYTLAIAWPMYTIFLVIDCLVLMSLLIALVIADIKSLRKQAVLKRLTMLVDLTLDVEKALPISLQKKLVKIEESVYPNKHKSWNLWSFWSFEHPSSNIKKKNKIKDIKKEQCDLKENIRTLRRRMKAIEAQNNRVEDLLNGIINRFNSCKLY